MAANRFSVGVKMSDGGYRIVQTYTGKDAKKSALAYSKMLLGSKVFKDAVYDSVIYPHVPRKRTYSHEAGKRLCECADSGCPIHKGKSYCSQPGTVKVWRGDMEDRTGTRMCRGCADDAMGSGLFYTNPRGRAIRHAGGSDRREGVVIRPINDHFIIYDERFREKKAGPFATYDEAKQRLAEIKSRRRYTMSPRYHAKIGLKVKHPGGQKKHNPGGAQKIYGRCLRIEAIKTTAHTYGGKKTAAGQRYFHDFTAKNAKIYGLPNGDLLISTR